MADIDLKELGILQEPQWWEPFLNIGMIIAAFFQAVCIGFAVFGPDSSDSGKILQNTKSSSMNQRRRGSISPTEQGQARKKSKQEKKKR